MVEDMHVLFCQIVTSAFNNSQQQKSQIGIFLAGYRQQQDCNQNGFIDLNVSDILMTLDTKTYCTYTE